MEVVFCLIPEDSSFKPAAADVARMLRMLVETDYVDNDEVYLDIGYESGHHRPGTSDMITVEQAAEALDAADDLELTDFSIENIRGTSKIPELFENCNQQNLSLMGWLAVRVFESAYPLFDSEEEYWIRCSFCGHQADHKEWACQDNLRRCPKCERGEELHALDFYPHVEFARLILEISELVFTETPPRLDPDATLVAQIKEVLGCELKPVWYRM